MNFSMVFAVLEHSGRSRPKLALYSSHVLYCTILGNQWAELILNPDVKTIAHEYRYVFITFLVPYNKKVYSKYFGQS